MKSFILIIGLLFSSFAFGHEGHDGHTQAHHVTFDGGTVHAHVKWTSGPQQSAASAFRIEWKDGATHAAAEPPGSFSVVLWMPDMGHGSAPTQIDRVQGASGSPLTGVFDVSNVYFVMGGLWQVNVILKYADGHEETQTIEVEIEGEHDHGHHLMR